MPDARWIIAVYVIYTLPALWQFLLGTELLADTALALSEVDWAGAVRAIGVGFLSQSVQVPAGLLLLATIGSFGLGVAGMYVGQRVVVKLRIPLPRWRWRRSRALALRPRQ